MEQWNNGTMEQGFTLVELIVVFAVMGLLTALFLANYRPVSERTEVEMSTQEMAANIRLAQSNTLGAAEYEGNVPEGGWGVYMEDEDDQYIIYADVDNNHIYSGESEKWQKKELPGGIYITSTGGGSRADVAFEPPDPTTYINGNSTSTDEVVVTIADNNDNFSQIKMNFFGLIEVLN
jgi:type II secretion system protein H